MLPSLWGRGLSGFEPFSREMDEMMQRFFAPAATSGGGFTLGQTWAPRVDVQETDKEIMVKADLPGVEAKDIEIAVNDGVLVLSGEKKEEKEEKGKSLHRTERFYGRFYRAIPLPAGADEDKVVAAAAKGVVTVTIPKKAAAQPRKITVAAKD
jgi:HSP20 family protein